MSTLWFDIMSRIEDDPDWSDLPETDKSSPLEYSGDYNDQFPVVSLESFMHYGSSRWKDVPGIGRKTEKQRKYSWLKPPEDWDNQHGG